MAVCTITRNKEALCSEQVFCSQAEFCRLNPYNWHKLITTHEVGRSRTLVDHAGFILDSLFWERLLARLSVLLKGVKLGTPSWPPVSGNFKIMWLFPHIHQWSRRLQASHHMDFIIYAIRGREFFVACFVYFCAVCYPSSTVTTIWLLNDMLDNWKSIPIISEHNCSL